MKPINVAIVGYGLSGRVFHGGILEGLKTYAVKKIVTKDPVKKEVALYDFKEAIVVQTAQEVFEDPEIDLVILCTMNTSHAPLAAAAMKAGKHVVVEKPFTVTADEAKNLLAIANETKKHVTVYHNRRFDADFMCVKALISEGRFGRIVAFESRFDRFRSTLKENAWRESALPGSGTLYDLGSHLIDQALLLFGVPESIYADLFNHRRGHVDDGFDLYLYYPEFKVTLKAGNLVKEAMPRFHIQGTEGAYVKFGMDVQEEALRAGKRPSAMGEMWGEEPENQEGVLNTIGERVRVKSPKGDYRIFYRQLYDAIVHGGPLPVKAEEAYRTMRVIEYAIQSHKEKRRIAYED